ncbi:uncharacterized protein BYT42DRAFT_576843 [Radiomyces spectabilis]|uniref:uncharacterized protein n=1 Tax=Radiomyces spectabilis TaxID=64574 RepID=UPI002220D9E4|nr:uncharacterized protein BYT42DRAFT_576843 [Radiomyces spectabilis]KAI8374578.1 hypothetical protein BYT42DRAFT_576843 [Radiomyces spectabilis]
MSSGESTSVLTTVNASDNSHRSLRCASPPTPTPHVATTKTSNSKHLSKALLRTALQKANSAVLCDSSNNVTGAIEAYTEAITLLNRVLATVERETDRRRLQEIHDSYSDRIRLLNAVSPKSDVENVYEKLDDPACSNTDTHDPEVTRPKEDVVKHTKRSSLHRMQDSPTTAILHMPSSSSLDSAFAMMDANKSVGSHRPEADVSDHATCKVSLPPLSVCSTHPSPWHPDASSASSSSRSTPTHAPSRSAKRPSFDAEHLDETQPNHSRSSSLSHYTDPGTPEAVHPADEIRSSIDDGLDEDDAIHRTSVGSASSLSSTDSEGWHASVSRTNNHHQPSLTLPSLLQLETPSSTEASKVPCTPATNGASIIAAVEAIRARSSSLPRQNQLATESCQSVETLTTVNTTKAPATGILPLSSSAPEGDTALQEDRAAHGRNTVPMRRAVTQPSPPEEKQSPTFTPPIHRPLVSRQSSGLGSVRRKAQNRLSRSSMDGSGRKDKGSPIFGLFLKDIMPSRPTYEVTADYLDRHTMSDVPESETVTPSKCARPLKLILSLESSMVQGGYVTDHLYIPKNLWFQPNIRLSSLDVKVSACENMAADLARLEKWKSLDDVAGSLKLLETLETTIEGWQISLSRKLKRESMDGGDSSSSTISDTSSITSSTGGSKKSQTLMSWGNKLTKSVERMNAFSLTKSEDQYRHYIDTLQRLFLKVHVLEHWLEHYSRMNYGKHELLVQKLSKICDLITVVVGGFVIRDMAILLSKWLKRGGCWVNE